MINKFFFSVPKDFKVNPGPVEAIAEQPGHPDNILIGYNRGLMVLWNKATPGAQQVKHSLDNMTMIIIIILYSIHLHTHSSLLMHTSGSIHYVHTIERRLRQRVYCKTKLTFSHLYCAILLDVCLSSFFFSILTRVAWK